MSTLHLLVSLLLASCLPGGFGSPDTEFGTGLHCVNATDAKGGAKCATSQIALCCNSAQTSQNCVAASCRACSDRFSSSSSFAPYCCDQLDMPGCTYVNSSSAVTCSGWVHPVEYRYCCAQFGNVTTPFQTYGAPIDSLGGINCENLYDMPSCPENRPKSFCC